MNRQTRDGEPRDAGAREGRREASREALGGEIDTRVTRPRPRGRGALPSPADRPDADPDVGKEVGTETDARASTGLRGGGD